MCVKSVNFQISIETSTIYTQQTGQNSARSIARYEASLELGKLYKIIPDEKAESREYVRVVDESGEDYAYSTSRFFRLEIPKPLEKALARAS